MSKMYDSKCMALATYFLDWKATQSTIDSLASAIQEAVEDWFSDGPTRFLLDNADSIPCPECSSQERHQRSGLLTCECPTSRNARDIHRAETCVWKYPYAKAKAESIAKTDSKYTADHCPYCRQWHLTTKLQSTEDKA